MLFFEDCRKKDTCLKEKLTRMPIFQSNQKGTFYQRLKVFYGSNTFRRLRRRFPENRKCILLERDCQFRKVRFFHDFKRRLSPSKNNIFLQKSDLDWGRQSRLQKRRGKKSVFWRTDRGSLNARKPFQAARDRKCNRKSRQTEVEEQFHILVVHCVLLRP